MNWLFLRGLVREQGHWSAFRQSFQNKFPEDQLCCLDIPGTGQRFAETSPCSIGALVDALRPHWLQHATRYPGPSAIFALSLGGMIATDWLQRYPLDFQRAVLINSSLRGYTPLWKRLRWQRYPEILRLLLTPDAASREKRILALVSNRRGKDPALQAEWIALQERHPVSKANALRQLFAAVKFCPPHEKPTNIPVLLLSGAQDRLVHPDGSRAIAERWGVELRTQPTAGHDIPLDEPEWLLEQVASWRGK